MVKLVYTADLKSAAFLHKGRTGSTPVPGTTAPAIRRLNLVNYPPFANRSFVELAEDQLFPVTRSHGGLDQKTIPSTFVFLALSPLATGVSAKSRIFSPIPPVASSARLVIIVSKTRRATAISGLPSVPGRRWH